VRIDYVGGHLDWANNPSFTDDHGHFMITTQSPAVVFRLPGYSSQRLLTRNASRPVIVMEKSLRHLQQCVKQSKGSDSTQLLWFPNLRLQKAKSRKHSMIAYYAGPAWTPGLPADRDIWLTESFQEEVFAVNEYWIVDSRGIKNGDRHWRQVGTFGETAFYSEVDGQTAASLDPVLDAVCLGSKK
jgi:hypothetical protein